MKVYSRNAKTWLGNVPWERKSGKEYVIQENNGKIRRFKYGEVRGEIVLLCHLNKWAELLPQYKPIDISWLMENTLRRFQTQVIETITGSNALMKHLIKKLKND